MPSGTSGGRPLDSCSTGCDQLRQVDSAKVVVLTTTRSIAHPEPGGGTDGPVGGYGPY